MANYVFINGQMYDTDVLAHHGIKGMKWGRRRFQNTDGSLTPAGKKRYVTTAQGVRNANQAAKEARKASLTESRATDSGIGSYRRAMNKASAAANEAYRDSIAKDKAYNKQLREEKKAAKEKTGPEHKGLSDKQKKALKVGAAVAGTALATYGAYRVSKCLKDKAFRQAYDRGVAANAKYMRDYNLKNVYSLGNDPVAKTKAVIRSNSISTRLSQENMEYAKRASSSTAKAIKTLLGKNYEIPVAELMNSGVNVFIPDRFNPKRV